jgi:hypothetical protein
MDLLAWWGGKVLKEGRLREGVRKGGGEGGREGGRERSPLEVGAGCEIRVRIMYVREETLTLQTWPH